MQLALTPTKWYCTWSIGTFFNQGFVVFASRPWMNCCPTVFTIVLEIRCFFYNVKLAKLIHFLFRQSSWCMDRNWSFATWKVRWRDKAIGNDKKLTKLGKKSNWIIQVTRAQFLKIHPFFMVYHIPRSRTVEISLPRWTLGIIQVTRTVPNFSYHYGYTHFTTLV